MKMSEHERRAVVYRMAAEEFDYNEGEITGSLVHGMCVAIGNDVLGVRWNGPETRPFRRELAKEVGDLYEFNQDLYSSYRLDRILKRGDILTCAAEYHEACVRAGRTL